MEWNGLSDKYFITSDAGHRVCITFHDGKKIYTAWPNKMQPDTPMLGIKETLEDAQALCEEHFSEGNTKRFRNRDF